MKRLFSLILAVVVATLTILSCTDDFNEQDFLQLQSDLKLKQDSIRRARNKAASDSSTKEAVESYIAAQNEAGSLLAVTVIVREDNTPIQGVTVTLSSGTAKPDGRTQAVLTATTDASGVAVFDAAVIANSTVTLSKTGYVSASSLADFGSPGAPIAITVPNPETGGTKTIYVSPQKSYVNISLPLFSESATAGNTAVISGVYNIENDLTNDPTVRDAIPAGQVITANIGAAMAAAGIINSSCGCVGDYRFTGAAGSLGVAAIDPVTGAFSMRVPATASGMSTSLILPTISGAQKIAVRKLNGQDITPEYRNVPTVWAPGNNPAVASNAIPTIPGAMAVFNTGTPPPPPGRGWGATFAVIGRSLDNINTTISANGNSTGASGTGNNTYNLALRGRGYSSSPAVAVNGGGGGSGATATASLRGYVTSASVTNGGTGYAASTAFDIDFFYTDATGNQVWFAEIPNVMSNASGVIVGNPNSPLTLPVTTGFPGGAMFTTDFAIQGFGVRVSVASASTLGAAAANTTSAAISFTTDTELNSVRITDGGTGYTAAPTFAFSGGGSPTTSAAMSIVAFRSQYTITLSTTAATTPYKLLPAGLVFTYPTNAVDAQSVESPAKVDRLSTNLSTVSTNADFIGQIVTDGTNITALDPQYTFRTTKFWTSAPTLSIVDQSVLKAAANLTISGVGEITNIVNPTGDAPTVNDLFPTAASTDVGDGYDGISVAIVPTVTGAPGSGASFLLTTSTNVNTEEVTWAGTSTRVTAGSGYLQNLNRTNTNVAYTSLSPISVQTGKIYPLVINAGTGIRSENVIN
jgi:hypothetical protein